MYMSCLWPVLKLNLFLYIQFLVPDSRSPQLNLTHAVKRNHVTGQATVVVNNHFKSHWKSMAIVEGL